MIKIAELINGKLICGDCNENDDWGHVLFIHLTSKSKGQLNVNFTPLVMFGDFNHLIKISPDKYFYAYEANSDFAQLYRQHVLNLRAAQSGVVFPSSADVSKFKNGKVIKIK